MDLSSKSYWDKRYEVEDNYEWLIRLDQVIEIFKEHANKDSKILIIGCGNSNLSYKLYLEGFRYIVSTDYSETIIDKMKSKYHNVSDLRWQCQDMFNLSYQNESFDIIFEKGVIDAVLANENQWSYADKFKTQFENFMLNINQILKIDGKFLSISFHQPMFRLPLIIDFDFSHRCDYSPKWKVDISEIETGFHFIFYNLQKTDKFHHSVDQLIIKYSKFHQKRLLNVPREDFTEENENFLAFGFEL